jgi:hypothetical protein
LGKRLTVTDHRTMVSATCLNCSTEFKLKGEVANALPPGASYSHGFVLTAGLDRTNVTVKAIVHYVEPPLPRLVEPRPADLCPKCFIEALEGVIEIYKKHMDTIIAGGSIPGGRTIGGSL